MYFEIVKVGRTAKAYQALEDKFVKFIGSLQHEVKIMEVKSSTDLNNKIAQDYQVILLTEHGKEHKTADFAKYLQKKTEFTGKVQFLIGDAFGFPGNFIERFPDDNRLALSKLTMPHDLAFVVLLEQIYRATTIWSGKRYDY